MGRVEKGVGRLACVQQNNFDLKCLQMELCSRIKGIETKVVDLVRSKIKLS